MFTKRSLSPLIATILLIVVSVILITVVLTWGKGFTESTIDNTDLFTAFTEDVDLKNFILVDSFIQTPTNNNLVLKNSSDKNINIVGYSLHSVDSNYVFLENKFYLEDALNLTSGSFNSLPILCAPSSRFSVQLITDQNTFVEIPIFTNNLDPNNYCFGVSNVVFRDTFSSEEETIALDGVPTDVTFENGIGSFNGTTSRIELTNLLRYFEGDFAIRLRFRVNAISDQVILYFSDVTKQKIGFSIRPDQDIFGWTFNGTVGPVHNINILEVGKWYDCVFVRIGSTNFAYVNGVTNVGSGTPWTSTRDFNKCYISSRGDSALPFDGDIDFLEIYEGTLTLKEVSLLYRSN